MVYERMVQKVQYQVDLQMPTWAGSAFDYNQYNITSLRLRK